ncbi:hypothetical protein HK098_001081 [Nowakowskiella sp. JEL0407]|nr:hypothetical protein HK098_001081 [Nowakowskiella sp. JEL0407]
MRIPILPQQSILKRNKSIGNSSVEFSPIPINDARRLISLYSLYSAENSVETILPPVFLFAHCLIQQKCRYLGIGINKSNTKSNVVVFDVENEGYIIQKANVLIADERRTKLKIEPKEKSPSTDDILKMYYSTHNITTQDSPFIQNYARYDVIYGSSLHNGFEESMSSIMLEVLWNDASATFSPPPSSAEALLTVRNLSGSRDPDNHVPTSNIRRELQIIMGWDKIRCGNDTWDNFIKQQEADELEEAKSLHPISLSIDGYLEGIAEENFATVLERQNELNNDTNNLDLMNLLPPRVDLDFSEKFWVFVKDAVSAGDLRDSIVALSDKLAGKIILPLIHKNNQTAFANQARLCLKLARMETSSEISQLEDMISSTFDFWIEQPLEIMVEVGIEKLKRDYVHHLVGNNVITLDHLEYFLDNSQLLDNQVLRLRCLHRILELWNLVKVNIISIPQEATRNLIQSAVSYYKRNLQMLENEGQVDDDAWNPDEPVIFTVVLPRFASGTTKVISNCTQSVDPFVWSVTLSPNQQGLNKSEDTVISYPLSVIRFDRTSSIFPIRDHIGDLNEYNDDEDEELGSSGYLRFGVIVAHTIKSCASPTP